MRKVQKTVRTPRLGIRTIGELAETEESLLTAHFGKMGSVLWTFANGYENSPVRKETEQAVIQSVGNGITAPRNLETEEDVKIIVYMLAESVGSRLRKHGFRCRTVEIGIRNSSLVSYTRQCQTLNATNITGEIAETAMKLFHTSYDWKKPVREISVRGKNLVNDTYWEQLYLFSSAEERERQKKLDRTTDELRRRFGYFSIQRGLMYCDRKLSGVDCESSHTVHPRGYFG